MARHEIAVNFSVRADADTAQRAQIENTQQIIAAMAAAMYPNAGNSPAVAARATVEAQRLYLGVLAMGREMSKRGL